MAILFVDDHQYVLDLLTHVCEEIEQPCFTASSGEEALSHCEDPKIGLIVTDLSMPGISGLHLAQAIREKRPDVKLFCFSGDPQNHGWDEIRACFDGIYFKPSDYSRMIAEALKELARRKYPFLDF